MSSAVEEGGCGSGLVLAIRMPFLLPLACFPLVGYPCPQALVAHKSPCHSLRSKPSVPHCTSCHDPIGSNVMECLLAWPPCSLRGMFVVAG